MKTIVPSHVRKRPVNLSLNEELVAQARQLTGNLSGVVESLLAEFVERELQRRREQSRRVEATVALWNDFEEKHGSFADEYSTL
ncbi:type II toxin-antitoxin system CcdA family antitoxin [Methylococcus sp. ANG]|uniref:type II toxin-antitoxin system CcdA family antitoxin n=1 Tax=Methylococcus sp. ANG TaxID=3231903 RepID=UPI0034586304